jgi:Histidine kinase-, DNA gyrase B-, and HSP90-like ATPase
VDQDPSEADERSEDKRVDAEPTKEFFVSMLVRDIELHDAVIDLLDNSVDGARRTRPGGDYTGLEVVVRMSAEEFIITDNCGGIPVDVAKRYAFRFGRDPGRPMNEHTIGQFGVGMKRTLFKLGQRFEITSKTVDDSFTLDVDVDEWRRDPRWDFWLETLARNESRESSETGTTIRVTRLNEQVSGDMTNDRWLNRLRSDARLKHRLAINKGLNIVINDDRLAAQTLALKESESLKPVRFVKEYPDESAPVKLTILAGISENDSQAAGWYVFCNDRLVLGPDRTAATVWEGGGRHTRGPIPAYHDQYSAFRGYVMFDCDDAARLPWTTTKKGVDADSPIWRDARQTMKDLTRPIIDFLNELDRERSAVTGDGRAGLPGIEDEELLTDLANMQVDEAPAVALDSVVGASSFTRPTVNLGALPAPLVWIRFSKPKSSVDQARRLLGGRTERDYPNKEVGSTVFDYFLENES